MKKIAVFLSDNVSGLQSILDGCVDHELHGRVEMVVATDANSHGVRRAVNAGVEHMSCDERIDASTDAFFGKLRDRLRELDIGVLVLLEYGLELPDFFIREFAPMIINIHPSLDRRHLYRPDAGVRAAKDAKDENRAETGCMALLVQPGPGDDPILAMEKVPIFADDSVVQVHQRVKKAERFLIHRVLRSVCEHPPVVTEEGRAFLQ